MARLKMTEEVKTSRNMSTARQDRRRKREVRREIAEAGTR
jgi:hypothetical protein